MLLSDTAWLTCTVIDAAQNLLKVLAHDKFSGFQSVAVGVTMQFEIQEESLYKYYIVIQATG